MMMIFVSTKTNMSIPQQYTTLAAMIVESAMPVGHNIFKQKPTIKSCVKKQNHRNTIKKKQGNLGIRFPSTPGKLYIYVVLALAWS